MTGIENPIMAGQELLKKGARLKWVIVKMGAKGSILITKSSITCAPGFKVSLLLEREIEFLFGIHFFDYLL